MNEQALVTDVLRAHARRPGIRDLSTHCLCGWASDASTRNTTGPGQHLGHQAEAVLAALHRRDGADELDEATHD